MTSRLRMTALAAAVALAMPGLSLAQMGGGMMGGVGGSGNGFMAGTGMLIVADDGSLLVTDMSGTTASGGTFQPNRTLADIGPDGSERWSVDFTDGWPMMPVTQDNLVVVSLVSDWWSGAGMMGDGGWGSGTQTSQQSGSDQATIVALDLTTGQEVWRTTLDGDMGTMAQFAPDGSRVYVSVVEMGVGMGGGGPMQQGDAAGTGTQATITLYALDPADGHTLWSHAMSGGGMGGMMATRRQQ